MKVFSGYGFRWGLTLWSLAWSAAMAQTDIRSKVGPLAARGLLDSAQAWVAQQLDSNTNLTHRQEARLVLGQLTLRGNQAIRSWQTLKSEKAPSSEQAEALYLLGQYHYAAGRYHLAIPEFREYLRRYPKGDDADRAGYWMANACLHLSLTQPDRHAYLDTGLAYIQTLPSIHQGSSYYAALAIECQAKLLLAKNEALAADRLLNQSLAQIPGEEKPAFFLLKAQVLRTLGKPYSLWIDSLMASFPTSPEAQYAQRFKGKIPAATSIREARKDSATATQVTTPTKVQSDSAANYWVLQVGSFAQKENAQAFQEQLVRLGFQSRVATSARGSQVLWQVWVGHFSTTNEAEKYGIAELRPKQILFTTRMVEPRSEP